MARCHYLNETDTHGLHKLDYDGGRLLFSDGKLHPFDVDRVIKTFDEEIEAFTMTPYEEIERFDMMFFTKKYASFWDESGGRGTGHFVYKDKSIQEIFCGSSSKLLLIIVGSIVGVIVVGALIAVVVDLVVRRRRQQQEETELTVNEGVTVMKQVPKVP